MAERILHLTLEILFRLTGEDYTVVKKTSSERCQDPVSEEWGRPLSPITGPPPHPLIHEGINDQKILELTYKMIELLTGEVPIRCQDVTVYFSMEEWEYLEGHKDLYKEVMMEDPQPLTSPVLSSERTTPERCPRPLLTQDCNQEDPDVFQDDQGEDLTDINIIETFVIGDEWCTEEIPTDNRTDDHIWDSDFTANDHGITTDTYEDHANISDIAPSLHSKHLSSDSSQQVLPLLQTVKQSKNHIKDEHQKAHKRKKLYTCSECGECFTKKSNFVLHERSHTGKKTFSYSECTANFTETSELVGHQKIHIGERLYACSECGKMLCSKAYLADHQRIHTGEKPFSCSQCGKSFNQKSALGRHHKVHTGEKPYSCSECGKCFTWKFNLVMHQKIHKGENVYPCSECGKCLSSKAYLAEHVRIHTGEKPFSCSECGKRFNLKSTLIGHQKVHTGEKPFSCSECGKCFQRKAGLVRHKISHMG
ncbi:uncharacterized protein ACNLHF_021757 [Anomaloglossus baeobatrachus]